MRLLKYISALLVCLLLSETGHAVQIRREPGHRIPESVLPTDRDNPVLWTGTTATYLRRAAAPGGYATNDIPRTGTIEYPLILVDFKDLHFTLQDTLALLERYERMFNERGYSDPHTYIHKGVKYYGAEGSVSDYFRDQSYGQYTPVFRIIGPVHPSKGYEYYGKGRDYNLQVLVKEICDSISAKGLTDLAGFARNGRIDQLSIIYAGRGENYSGSDVNTIWPQADTIWYNRNGVGSIRFACTCELFWDSDTIPDGIGTFCHEFSHTLGLPDFYNTQSASESETNSAMGYWSIMDYGNYENGGFSPVGYTAFEKYSLGWMDIEEIGYAGYYTLNDISKRPDPDAAVHSAYRLSTGFDDEFIILENHVRTGWYKYHASEGLMVTAVSYDNNRWNPGWNSVNSDRKFKHYHILPADNDYNRGTNAGDLFPYNGTDSITTTGKPVLKAGDSYPSYSVYNIRSVGGIISFHAGPDLISEVAPRHDDEITINIIDGNLQIDAPVGRRVSVHDLSGRTVSEVVTSQSTQRIALPGQGIWIVKCGNMVRKLRVEN